MFDRFLTAKSLSEKPHEDGKRYTYCFRRNVLGWDYLIQNQSAKMQIPYGERKHGYSKNDKKWRSG